MAINCNSDNIGKLHYNNEINYFRSLQEMQRISTKISGIINKRLLLFCGAKHMYTIRLEESRHRIYKPFGIIRMSERNQHKLHKIIFFYRCSYTNWSSWGKEVKNCCISVFERFSSDNRNISTINNVIEAIYEKAKVE